jgi:hypothetical protein
MSAAPQALLQIKGVNRFSAVAVEFRVLATEFRLVAPDFDVVAVSAEGSRRKRLMHPGQLDGPAS